MGLSFITFFSFNCLVFLLTASSVSIRNAPATHRCAPNGARCSQFENLALGAVLGATKIQNRNTVRRRSKIFAALCPPSLIQTFDVAERSRKLRFLCVSSKSFFFEKWTTLLVFCGTFCKLFFKNISII